MTDGGPRSPDEVAPSPLAGRTVIVTGGAGSFGQAFVRRCLEDGARRVAVYSRDEAKQAAMSASFNDPRLRFMVGDVRDSGRLYWALRDTDIVIHAAALKRVETCEADPLEAVATNVEGSANVGRVAIERAVDRAIFLSTDKAAAPNTLYGSTKLTAERIWNGMNVYSAGTGTRFACTRYGNVLGSRGSVVPVWKEQALCGGPIGITDPTMTRFWMPMSAAVDLVILALREMRGGEVFVPKIGAAPIKHLAEAVVPRHAWFQTGLRPGEKLHETLITADEARSTHDCGTHYVIEPAGRSWGDVAPLRAPLVQQPFEYRSDTNLHQLSIPALRELAAA